MIVSYNLWVSCPPAQVDEGVKVCSWVQFLVQYVEGIIVHRLANCCRLAVNQTTEAPKRAHRSMQTSAWNLPV